MLKCLKHLKIAKVSKKLTKYKEKTMNNPKIIVKVSINTSGPGKKPLARSFHREITYNPEKSSILTLYVEDLAYEFEVEQKKLERT